MSAASQTGFEFEVPISFFEKADAPKGTRRRHGGLISTDSEDLQGETVLQDGMDLDPFKTSGWFNDNHDKSTAGIIGYPDSKAVKVIKKGDKLPDGTMAKSNGIWAEGYLMNTDRGNAVWQLAKELKDTGRSLGYSVEGSVIKRDGPKTVLKKSPDGSMQLVGNRVVKAVVRNVAITGCPVQPDSRLSILAKSLEAMQAEEEEIGKAMTAGTPDNPGSGNALIEESLEGGVKRDESDKKKKKKKKLPDAEAVQAVQKSVPGISLQNAALVVEMTKQLKRSGRLQ